MVCKVFKDLLAMTVTMELRAIKVIRVTMVQPVREVLKDCKDLLVKMEMMEL